MADTKADTAETKTADTKATTESKPAAAKQPAKAKTTRKPAASKASATKSAGEGENLPGASAPAVASEAGAARSDTTLTAGEARELVTGSDPGDFGPFRDNAPPVGAALDATLEEVDTGLDFDVKDVPYTVAKGDIVVAVREHNQRNIVDIAPAGWTGPGQIFAPYQVKHLIKALQEIEKRLR